MISSLIPACLQTLSEGVWPAHSSSLKAPLPTPTCRGPHLGTQHLHPPTSASPQPLACCGLWPGHSVSERVGGVFCVCWLCAYAMLCVCVCVCVCVTFSFSSFLNEYNYVRRSRTLSLWCSSTTVGVAMWLLVCGDPCWVKPGPSRWVSASMAR